MRPLDPPVDCCGKPLAIGDAVTFRHSRARIGDTGTILRHRRDPRPLGGMGWLDIQTEKGERSVRPTHCSRVPEDRHG
jgi:hypothetical protein